MASSLKKNTHSSLCLMNRESIARRTAARSSILNFKCHWAIKSEVRSVLSHHHSSAHHARWHAVMRYDSPHGGQNRQGGGLAIRAWSPSAQRCKPAPDTPNHPPPPLAIIFPWWAV